MISSGYQSLKHVIIVITAFKNVIDIECRDEYII